MFKKLLILFVIVFSFAFISSCTGEFSTDFNTSDLTTEESSSSTDEPTTVEPTTEVPTTEVPTTDEPSSSTDEPSTEVPTTEEPTTEEPTTEEPTTEVPTTEVPTTEVPTTEVPTTEVPTTEDNYYDAYVDLLAVHSMSDGAQLTVSGVVYFMTQNGYYIQDDTYNLFIFTNSAPSVELGDRVVVSGELTTYREVKQIKNPILDDTTAFEQDITQAVINFEYGVTQLEPGHLYRLTGEVRIETSYNTSFLYIGNTKVAEIYYKSLAHSISAIEAYVGEIITLDLLYYAEGDDVPRYAFQGSESHIQVYIPDDSIALQEDVNLLDTEKILFNDYDFGRGYYGSTYEIIEVSGDISDYVYYNGSVLYVTKPTETEGDASGTIVISVSLNDETPILKTVNIIIKAEGSSTIDMSYYQSIIGLSGDALLYELNEIINNGFKQMSYDDAKWVLEESDRDPNNANNVILVYTRESVQGQWNYPNWNREHTWPQSKLNTSGQKADMHNLKPSDVAENSRRGNLPFGYMTGSGVYEPHDDVKGDVARIVFYMATMYLDLNVESGILGQMSILLEWHNLDPVDDFERNRNEVIYSYQGNRNPFIDYPQLVEEIWG